MRYNLSIYCGLRDVQDVQRDIVQKAGAGAILGDAKENTNFPLELNASHGKRDSLPALIQFGSANGNESVRRVKGLEIARGWLEEIC
jgi:arginase